MIFYPKMEGSEIPKRLTTQKAPPLKCPRCYSTNTKFCYYNNYSLAQPRHFCRTCHRHWTAGGTLRNIPVSGRRKNKRQKTTTSAGAGRCNFPAINNPAVAENSGGCEILLAGNFRPLEFEFERLSSGFTLPVNSTSLLPSNSYSFWGSKEGFAMNETQSTASIPVEDSLVFPASFLDFWDCGADFTAGSF